MIEYEVEQEEAEEPEKVFIDYNFEEKYGRRRRLVTVYKKKSQPLAKFIGTDRYSMTLNVAWKMLHDGSRKLVRDLRNKPEGYESFKPVRFRKIVNGSGASACWAVSVRENPRALIHLGLIREEKK